MIEVILEGCSGDWAQTRYIPMLAQKALKNQLDLIAVDVVPSPPNVRDEHWNTAKRQNKIRYLDKKTNTEQYTALSDIHRVFIVTPDRLHCKIADFWLSRLTPTGKIFIEKPLDASLESAVTLRKKKGVENTVYAFDHYLARASPFLYEKAQYLARIGDIERIECRILESHSPKHSRIGTLRKGVIFDLFSHVLSLVAGVKGSLIPELMRRTILHKIRVARYADWPIHSESFALIDFNMDSTPVRAIVGYSVITDMNKVMFIHGTRGKIKLDFTRDRFLVTSTQGSESGDLQPRHVESFLESALQDDIPSVSGFGVMNFDVALEILRILEKCKAHICTMSHYQCNTSLEDILEILHKTLD